MAETRSDETGVRLEEPDAFSNDSYHLPFPGGVHYLTQAMNALGTLWIIGLMFLINIDVIGRNFFDAPVRGATELVSLSIVGIVFLQLADTLHAGGLTRATVLIDSLHGRPTLAALLNAIHHLIGAAFMVVILWAAWEPLLESIHIREYVGAIGDFTAPVWPVRLIMLVGLMTTALVFFLLALADIRRCFLIKGARVQMKAGH